MRILETYLQGKFDNPDLCEDNIFVGGTLLAVVDGATTTRSDFPTPGHKAMEAVMACLQAIDVDKQRENMAMWEILNRVNGAVMSVENGSASIILYDVLKKQIWNYGDCRCWVDGVVHLHDKEIDTKHSILRTNTIRYYLNHGMTEKELLAHDLGREEILPLIASQLKYANSNSTYGYPVLNGGVLRTEMARCYEVQEGSDVVLASDGYPVISQRLDISEAALTAVLRQDPLCYKLFPATKGCYPGQKSFDDRAWLHFTV